MIEIITYSVSSSTSSTAFKSADSASSIEATALRASRRAFSGTSSVEARRLFGLGSEELLTASESRECSRPCLN